MSRPAWVALYDGLNSVVDAEMFKSALSRHSFIYVIHGKCLIRYSVTWRFEIAAEISSLDGVKIDVNQPLLTQTGGDDNNIALTMKNSDIYIINGTNFKIVAVGNLRAFPRDVGLIYLNELVRRRNEKQWHMTVRTTDLDEVRFQDILMILPIEEKSRVMVVTKTHFLYYSHVLPYGFTHLQSVSLEPYVITKAYASPKNDLVLEVDGRESLFILVKKHSWFHLMAENESDDSALVYREFRLMPKTLFNTPYSPLHIVIEDNLDMLLFSDEHPTIELLNPSLHPFNTFISRFIGRDSYFRGPGIHLGSYEKRKKISKVCLPNLSSCGFYLFQNNQYEYTFDVGCIDYISATADCNGRKSILALLQRDPRSDRRLVKLEPNESNELVEAKHIMNIPQSMHFNILNLRESFVILLRAKRGLAYIEISLSGDVLVNTLLSINTSRGLREFYGFFISDGFAIDASGRYIIGWTNEYKLILWDRLKHRIAHYNFHVHQPYWFIDELCVIYAFNTHPHSLQLFQIRDGVIHQFNHLADRIFSVTPNKWHKTQSFDPIRRMVHEAGRPDSLNKITTTEYPNLAQWNVYGFKFWNREIREEVYWLKVIHYHCEETHLAQLPRELLTEIFNALITVRMVPLPLITTKMTK